MALTKELFIATKTILNAHKGLLPRNTRPVLARLLDVSISTIGNIRKYPSWEIYKAKTGTRIKQAFPESPTTLKQRVKELEARLQQLTDQQHIVR